MELVTFLIAKRDNFFQKVPKKIKKSKLALKFINVISLSNILLLEPEELLWAIKLIV